MPISQDQYVKDLVQRMSQGAPVGQAYNSKRAEAEYLNSDDGIQIYGNKGARTIDGNSRYAQQTRRYENEADQDYDARMDRYYGDDIKARTGYNSADNRAMVQAILSGNPDKMGKFFSKDYVNPGDEIDNRIKAFVQKMQADLDTNDPEVRQAMAIANNVAQRQSRNSGLRGGLSTSGVAQATINGMNPLRQFRQQQALQGLNLLSGRNIQTRQLGMQEDAAAREAQNEIWAKNNALAQMIIGGVGTVGSIVAAPFTGGASLALTAPSAAAFGSGMSGMGARPPSRGYSSNAGSAMSSGSRSGGSNYSSGQ